MLWFLGGLPVFAQSVTLTWYASADPSAVGYKVYFGGASGVYTNSFGVGTATNVTVYALTPGTTYYFTATTVSSNGTESAFSNEAQYYVPNTNSDETLNSGSLPPTLNDPASVTVYQNAGQQTVTLTGISAGTSGNATANVYAVSSDNGTVITAPGVSYSNPNSTGTLTFTPVAPGTATVTVTVTNDDTSASQTFTVTVLPVPVVTQPPTLDPITNLFVYQTAGQQTVALTGIGAGTSGAATVTISAVSDDNGAFITAPNINYTNGNNTATLTFSPVGTLGTANVTVTVNNGGTSNNAISQVFSVTVVPAPPTLDPVANVTLYQNAGLQTLNLTSITPGTSGTSNVNVYATCSDNGTILSAPTVNYSNPDTTATFTFIPTGATGTSTVTITVDNGGPSNNITTQVFVVSVLPVPQATPPSLNPLASYTLYQNAGLQTVNLTGITPGTSGNPTVNVYAVSSDNGTVITPPVLNYSNPNTAGTLTFSPVAGASGSATVTVTVDNGSITNNPTSQSFTVTVVPTPLAPTLNTLTNLTLYENAGTQTVSLAGINVGSAYSNQTLTVSAASSNPSLIPTPAVNYTNPNSTGTLTFAPTANAVGKSTVTITLNNGGIVSNLLVQSFTITVLPGNPPPTLGAMTNVTLLEDSSPETITLTGITTGSTNSRVVLRVSAASSNSRLIPAPMVAYRNPANTAQLILRPNPGVSGQANITVTVSDSNRSNNIVQQSFTVTILPIQPPTLNPIANITVADNAGAQTVLLTGISSGTTTPNAALRVSATTSNPRVASISPIQYTSPSNTAVLTFKPLFVGSAIVTVMVSDGNRVNSMVRQEFKVTVTPSVTNTVVASVVSQAVSAPQADISQQQNVAATLTSAVQANGVFSFDVNGISGGKYTVQATTDFKNWTLLATNTVPFTFEDNTISGSPQRFYRAVYVQP